MSLATGEAKAPHYISRSVNSRGESIGNGLFAGRKYEAGEQIALAERPLLGSLDSQRLLDTCANCYVWTEGAGTGSRIYVPAGTNVQKCAGCQRFRYCSKACQKEAWTRGHKHECKVLRQLVGKDIPKAVLGCMELLTRRKHGLISDDQWTLVCGLQTHIDDFKRNGSYENIELMSMGASQFSLTQKIFDKDFVAAMYARVLTNSLTLIAPTLDPLGIIFDPFLGHINHSCDPNAFVIMDGPKCSLRTLKPIEEAEEIYISYIDATNPYYRRQSELKNRWFFKCDCTKCQKGATLDEDKWAGKPATLNHKVKEVADGFIEFEQSAQDPANYVGESRDERRAAAIQGHAFTELERAQAEQDPDKAMLTLEGAIRICHQSGLWPVHRQPFPAIRDELIVTLLSTSNYVIAWTQCAKRYKHILPKLYPVQFHPIRVVQTWQMAVIAVYLAGTPEGIGAPGVNMGLIAMMLVKQVLDTAKLSHGPDSAFTRSVQAKAEEMTVELRRSLGDNPDNNIMNQELEAQRDLLVQMGDWIKM